MEPKLAKDTILILGGDGYLGWSLGLAFANRTDKTVVLVDNLIKRRWEKQVSAKLLVPLQTPSERVKAFTTLYGKTNLSFEKADLLDDRKVVELLQKYRPSIVINAAQQPSAPFSMMSARNSAATYSNNIVGNLNLLWGIAEVDKNITYIKLGSAGCFAGIDATSIPNEKVDMQFMRDGKTNLVRNTWLPMYATDFYHQTKISDFLMDELAAEVWGLKVLTVQQSTIFGATIEENRRPEHHVLATRFNYDSIFSTVLNRFACQIAIGHPMTIYGEGEQRTGIVSLCDTVNNFIEFAKLKLKPGEHRLLHNYTLRFSINEIAQSLKSIDQSATISHIKNPRKETEGTLRKTVEVEEIVGSAQAEQPYTFIKELRAFLDFTKLYKDNIDRSIILPTVEWDKHAPEPSHIKVQHAESESVFTPEIKEKRKSFVVKVTV